MIFLFVVMTSVIIGALYVLIVAPNRVAMSALNERIENLENIPNGNSSDLGASRQASARPEEPTPG